VYPPISHWVWTDVGWLNRLGYVDFSGCGPVHLLGGVCSFFGALFLGPRLGRFDSKYGDSEKEEIVGHSIPVSTRLKAKAVPLYATQALGGRGDIAPIHFRP
jgi:Amt family ammonium transporter